jgi:N-acylneuraminate cytidylyltransferase
LKKIEKKIIAIIPARKGSKSIKGKNIIPFKGRPLLYYSIRVALKSKLIDEVIVSTDSKKYKKIAIKYGAKVPYLRPKKYSSDKSLDIDFMRHAARYFIKRYDQNSFFFVLLRPTTPMRDYKIVDLGIKKFMKNFNRYDSMRSVSRFNQPPQKMFYIKKKTLMGYFDDKYKFEYHSYPRQSFFQSYLPNGYIDILKPSYFLNSKKKLFGKIYPFITKEILDIDEKKDLLK